MRSVVWFLLRQQQVPAKRLHGTQIASRFGGNLSMSCNYPFQSAEDVTGRQTGTCCMYKENRYLWIEENQIKENEIMTNNNNTDIKTGNILNL